MIRPEYSTVPSARMDEDNVGVAPLKLLERMIRVRILLSYFDAVGTSLPLKLKVFLSEDGRESSVAPLKRASRSWVLMEMRSGNWENSLGLLVLSKELKLALF